MRTMNLTKRQFEKLKRLELGKEIMSTECKMHIIPSKNKWSFETKLLKEFYIKEGRTFGNKLNTINTLIDEGKKIGIEELIMPEQLAVVDNRVVGFTMPYIENNNLYYELSNAHVPTSEKIRYLKEIGIILDKIKKAREYGLIDTFFLGDIHEQNFIVNSQTKKVNVVDLDSALIGKNSPFPAKYLVTNKVIRELPTKYPKCNGLHVPNVNTDIFCYDIMILNYIAKYPINELDISEFYDYLNYLSKLGFNGGLLSSLSKIYLASDNINPVDYIETIPDLPLANYRAYQYQLKKGGK